MALTKDGIVEALVTKHGLQRREAVDFLDTFLDDIKKGVSKGERIKFAGFGAFYKKTQRYQRKRRDIPVDEDTPPWCTVAFFPAKPFRDKLHYSTICVSRDTD